MVKAEPEPWTSEVATLGIVSIVLTWIKLLIKFVFPQTPVIGASLITEIL